MNQKIIFIVSAAFFSGISQVAADDFIEVVTLGNVTSIFENSLYSHASKCFDFIADHYHDITLLYLCDLGKSPKELDKIFGFNANLKTPALKALEELTTIGKKLTVYQKDIKVRREKRDNIEELTNEFRPDIGSNYNKYTGIMKSIKKWKIGVAQMEEYFKKINENLMTKIRGLFFEFEVCMSTM